MADIYSPRKRSSVMSRVRGRDTRPELAVRRALTELGYRYRLHSARLPGRPDVVIGRVRTVVLVHGCFWHRHRCAKGRSVPATNTDFWLRKIARNVERDAEQVAALRALGWKIVTVWECETREHSRLVVQLRKRMTR
jgi:DNA mismatch endonuclease (patch repair protein)